MLRGLVKSLPISLPHSIVRGDTGGGGTGPAFTLSGTLPNGDQGTDYLGVLNISGGIAPYSSPTVISGSLPGEFSLAVVGSQLQVTATAPITFSGTVTCTLQVQDTPHATASLPVTFTITVVHMLQTEGGVPITTEDGKFIATET